MTNLLPTRHNGNVLTGVSGQFTAHHNGPNGEPAHEHTWKVLAWFDPPERADARCYLAALQSLLVNWHGMMLPDRMMWGEDIARTVGLLASCVEVVVTRDDECIHARWLA